MAEESALRFLLLIPLLLVACGMNPRVNTPVYVQPETRAQAAHMLTSALSKGRVAASQFLAGDASLRWHEKRNLSDRRSVMVQRELVYAQMRAVAAPRPDMDAWMLRIDAAGGDVVFHFRDNHNAAQARAALQRLMRAD